MIATTQGRQATAWMNAAPDQPARSGPPPRTRARPALPNPPSQAVAIRGTGTNAARPTAPSIPRRPQASVRNRTKARATPAGRAIAPVVATSRSVSKARPIGRATSPGRLVATSSPDPGPESSAGRVASRTIAAIGQPTTKIRAAIAGEDRTSPLKAGVPPPSSGSPSTRKPRGPSRRSCRARASIPARSRSSHPPARAPAIAPRYGAKSTTPRPGGRSPWTFPSQSEMWTWAIRPRSRSIRPAGCSARIRCEMSRFAFTFGSPTSSRNRAMLATSFRSESSKGSSSIATSSPKLAACSPIDRTHETPAAHCSPGGMTSFCQTYSPRTSRTFLALNCLAMSR